VGRTRIRTSGLALVAIALLVTSSTTASAQAPVAAAFTAPAPGELAAPVKAALGDAGAKVTVGGTTLEFWWVKTLAATGGASWSGVEEGALVGAVRVTGPFKEIRGKTAAPGAYTLRYGLQPQNGDHLGASPFREFLLLSPAADDPDPRATGHDGAIATAKKTTGTSHPASLSLDPPEGAAGPPLSVVSTELGHTGVIFQVTTPAGPLAFGLVVIGLIEH
jgi:hypothetical protein